MLTIARIKGYNFGPETGHPRGEHFQGLHHDGGEPGEVEGQHEGVRQAHGGEGGHPTTPLGDLKVGVNKFLH